MENKKPTPKRLKFNLDYSGFSDSQVLLEILFAQQIQIDKLENTRSNTSKLVWWLIAIPILIFLFVFLFGLGGLAAGF